MGYFDNYKTVDLKKLRESGIYSEEVLKAIETGDYITLRNSAVISQDQRRNIDFMGPIVYAYQERNGSYITYKCCAENVQKNYDFAIDIIKEEPEVIKDTFASRDGNFIQRVAQEKPEIIIHMSENLKSNTTFTVELCNMNNSEITKYAAQECKMPETIERNPEFSQNKDFMMGLIQKDVNSLQYASDNLKNDSDFIKETSKENYEVIEYIINNKEDFKLDAIKGAKDTAREVNVEESMQIIDTMSQESDDDRYKKVLEKVKEKGEDDVHTVRWTTAMAAQSDKVTPEYFKKVFNDSILTMLEIQKDLTPEGEEKVSKENIQKMVTPLILNKLKEKAIENGLQLDEDMETKIEEYTEFFNHYREKLNEEKAKKIQKKEPEGEVLFKPEDMEMPEKASFNGVKENTLVIRTGVEENRRKNVETGEKTYDKSDD